MAFWHPIMLVFKVSEKKVEIEKIKKQLQI